MSGLGDTVGNFRALGAAAARLFADALDGPEPCGHDYDTPTPGPARNEWARGWTRGWASAEEAYGVGLWADETSSAVGLRRSQTPGEESGDPLTSPSPGGHQPPNAADVLAEAQVREDELSAHITAIRGAWHDRWQSDETNALTLSDEIARDLTSDYRITKK